MSGIKIIAIYNVWDGEEHLEKSVKSLEKYVDDFIGVVQFQSNKGEYYDNGVKVADKLMKCIEFKPNLGIPAIQNEINKRKLGLDYARKFTHFIFSDCDEVWKGIEPRKYNTASKIYTYYKHENLTTGLDSYYVPAICPLPSDNGFAYFHAWKAKGFYCDPTRACKGNVIEQVGEMHHYSWVRNDIGRKMRNSSANLTNNQLLQDYNNACEGYKIKYGTYAGKVLKKV